MPRLLAILLLGWAIAVFGSFLAFFLTPAKDFGLTAGLNKVTVFMGWQAVATVLSFASLAMRWSSRDKITRRFAAIPALALAVMLMAFAALLFWANMKTAPLDTTTPLPPKPVTAPVDN